MSWATYKKNVGGTGEHYKEIKKQVQAKTDAKCWYCGRPYKPERASTMCIEHMLPESRGGTWDIENLVPACISCNSRKKGRSLEEFRERMRWRRNGLLPFSEAQTKWLEDNGIEIPIPNDVIFWGEVEDKSVPPIEFTRGN